MGGKWFEPDIWGGRQVKACTITWRRNSISSADLNLRPEKFILYLGESIRKGARYGDDVR
jgi:hypothetical protein